MSINGIITLNDSPFIEDQLTVIRDKLSSTAAFLTAVDAVARQLLIAGLQFSPTGQRLLDTPAKNDVSCGMMDPEHETCMAYIMRAGRAFIPEVNNMRKSGVRMSEIFIEETRNEHTLEATSAGGKMPRGGISQPTIFVGEPMCATGGSTVLGIDTVMQSLADQNVLPTLVCLHYFATDHGLAAVREKYPHVKQIAAVIDPELTVKGWISPGCGDFGDRLTGVIPR